MFLNMTLFRANFFINIDIIFGGQKVFYNFSPQVSLILYVDFTLLAMDMPNTAPSELHPQPVKAMIQLFGWDDIICPQVAARYLSHFLQNR